MTESDKSLAVNAGCMRRIWILIGCAFLASTLAWGHGYAQERLKISYSSIDAPNANWYIAEDKRIYQKYGLDTDLIFISSSTTNVAAVVAGYVKVGNISGGALANAAVGGADLVCVGSFINTLPYDLIVNESIKSPQSLKDKSIGISRVGSSSDVAARVLLKALGLEPDRDVAILQVGGSPEGQPLFAPAESQALPRRQVRSSSAKVCPTAFLSAWETCPTAIRFPTSA